MSMHNVSIRIYVQIKQNHSVLNILNFKKLIVIFHLYYKS